MSGNLTTLDSKLLAILGTGGLNSIGLPKREIFLLDIVVAGTSFCKEINDIAQTLGKDTLLRMVRKPKNEYDQYAIALFWDKIQVGWVPQELNLIISRLMDAGKEFYAKVTSKKLINNWWCIGAQIYMVE
ncbi:MAG: HIRAN domain-containing protein [Porphyromonas sp.]|nr:HIRAN domain-containing protein [Bacteroidales bacterium]MDY3100547.1 HIRAN domain-containing protein [Porphyromonas sp.]